MSTKFDLISYIKGSSVIQGSPETTYGKTLTDGKLESYGDIARRSRKEINYHLFNGTDIPAIRNTMIAGIVGEKINIQSRNESQKINNDFEALLKEHSKIKNFEITGRFHRDEGLRQIVGMEVVNGGVIIRHHYNTAWKIPYKIELVGVDMIDTTQNIYLKNIRNGLKTDKYGTVIGIYLYDDYEKTKSSLYSTENMTIYTPVWMSLSQYTAVSRIVSILSTLDASIIYRTEEIKAAIERAKSGVYWHTELFAELQEALSEYLKSQTSEARIAEAKELINDLSRRGIGSAGATATPKDDKITQVDTKTDSIYQALTDENQKGMSSAVGGSQVSIYRDIAKGNYSSIKAAISFDEEHYKIEFDRLSNTVMEDYLTRLFQVGIQTNRISLARSKYFSNPEKYHNWDILRTSKRVIDEEKGAKATAKQLESGATDLYKVYGEKGLDLITEKSKQIDVDIQIEQMKKQKYEKAGLPYPAVDNSAQGSK
jgi:capsid protein